MDSNQAILLSDQGGDRATAYVMSTKIVEHQERLLCTWLDYGRLNQWALVEPWNREIVASGPLGQQGVDNHCGAALAISPSGAIHAITGGHHTALDHHILVHEGSDLSWRPAASLGANATYPSLVSDPQGALHLAFRTSGELWTLCYCRFQNGIWSAPRVLVRAEKPGYIYWTNGLAVGPEGRLHLAFSNTRVLPDGSLYLGASHLYSDDAGESWHQFGGRFIPQEGVPVGDLAFIEGEMDPERIEPPEHQKAYEAPGPLNYSYLQMNVSNPVTDALGRPAVIRHNGMNGSVTLYRHDESGWSAMDLMKAVEQAAPGWFVHMQSSLSRHADGTLEAALMIRPTRWGWGPPETELLRVTIPPSGEPMGAELVGTADLTAARWLPALQPWSWKKPFKRPALLFTEGRNAGGFQNNQNELRTRVWLIPPEG